MKANKSMLLEFDFDSLKTLEEDEDLAIAEIDLLHLGVNRNNCDISKEAVELSKQTFYDKPIIYRYNYNISDKLSNDFGEHSTDGDPTMNIAGHIPSGSNIEYVNRDGKTYVRVTCILHKVYLPSLMRILESRDGSVKISIELVVLDGNQDEESGILAINKFKLRGVCLLGADIIEGIEGSQMNVVKFSSQAYNNFYHDFCKDNIIEITPDIIDTITNSYSQLEKNSEDVLNKDIVLAKNIIKNCKISKNNIPQLIDRLQNGSVKTFDLLGGKDMYDYIINAVKGMGDGKAISVDKSASSLSETSWGDVDKTALRNEVLKASNYKSLVKDVYCSVEEGWEDAPSSKLKYPIMEIKDGKAVYNRGGLASALGYARAEKDSAVVNKIEAIYKKLKIDTEGKERDNEMITNKLDKGNKDIDKIKDDAEAQEDDVKEKDAEKKEDKKPEEKVENACGEEAVKNEIEPHDKGKEGLEDDVDSDKDYWRKRAEENQAKFEEMNKRVMALEREKEVGCMSGLLKDYQVCLNEDEYADFEKSMKKMTQDDFSRKLFEQIALHAKEEKMLKNGQAPQVFSAMPAFAGLDIKEEKKTLSDLSKEYSNKK